MPFKQDLEALLLTAGGTTFELQLVSTTGAVLARQVCTPVIQGTENFVFSMSKYWQCIAGGVPQRVRFTNSQVSTIVDSIEALRFTGGTEVKIGDILIGPEQVTVTPGAVLTDLVPDTLTITENAPDGATLVNFTGAYPLATLTLTNDAGGRLSLEGTALRATAVNINYEVTPTLTATIQQVFGLETLEQTFVFTVADVAEVVLVPLTMTQNSLPEGSPEGFVVGTLVGAQGGALTLEDTAGNRFKLVAGEIQCGAVATDYATATSHQITVRETLAGSEQGFLDTVLTIQVSDVIAAPANTVLPLLSFPSSPARAGDVIACSQGTWTGEFLSFSYQWRKDGVNITGATSSGYTIAAADELTEIDCRVTASNTSGSVTVTSSNKIGVYAQRTVTVPATGNTSLNPPLTLMPALNTADVTATPGADWRYTL